MATSGSSGVGQMKRVKRRRIDSGVVTEQVHPSASAMAMSFHALMEGYAERRCQMHEREEDLKSAKAVSETPGARRWKQAYSTMTSARGLPRSSPESLLSIFLNGVSGNSGTAGIASVFHVSPLSSNPGDDPCSEFRQLPSS